MSKLTAAYIAMGYITCSNPPPIVVQEHFDGGQLALIDNMVHYAEYLDELSEAGFAFCGEYPGVFDYEVSEAFGPRYALMIMACEPGHVPSLAGCCNELLVMTFDFFLKSCEPTAQQRIDLGAALGAVPLPKPYGAA